MFFSGFRLADERTLNFLPSVVVALLAAGCLLFAAVTVGSFFAPTPAQAQDESATRYNVKERSTNVAYFQFAQPGQATIQVSMWGTIPRSGIYEVRENTRIDKLLTMAGGMPIQPRSENQKRTMSVRLLRERADGGRDIVYEAPLDSLLRNTGNYPTLQDEDVLVVETEVEDPFEWLDLLSIVGSVASVALTVDRLLPGGIFTN